MRSWHYIMIASAVGAAGLWFLKNPADKKHPMVQKNQTDLSPKPNTITDPATVFQKAFWKRPSDADKILHAERREWSDEHGISRWQWFLEVEPSVAIVNYLREENNFRLVTVKSATIPNGSPAWFIKNSENCCTLAATDGTMQLIFTPGDTKLYATSKGGGFRPGAPEKSVALPQAHTASRLPPSSPNLPAKP